MKKNIPAKVMMLLIALSILALSFVATTVARYVKTINSETVFTMNVFNRYPDITNNLNIDYSISGSPLVGYTIELKDTPIGFTHIAYDKGDNLEYVEIVDNSFTIDTGLQETVTLDKARMYAFATVDNSNNMYVYNRLNRYISDDSFEPDGDIKGTDVYKFKSGKPEESNGPDGNVSDWSAVNKSAVSVTIVDSVKPTAVKKWFNSFTSLKSFSFKDGDRVLLDLSGISDITEMFFGCTALESIDLTGLNTSNIETFTSLFRNCTSLKSVNMSDWNTSKATLIRTMFYNCTNIESIDLTNFNTGNVREFNSMFGYCTSLKSVKVGTGWKVTTDPNNIFTECTALVIKDGQLGSNTINYSKMSGENINFAISNCTFPSSSTHLAIKVNKTTIEEQVEYRSGTNMTSFEVSPANAGGTFESHILTLYGAKKYAYATVDRSNNMRIYNRLNSIGDTFVPDNMDLDPIYTDNKLNIYKFRDGSNPTGTADPEGFNDEWSIKRTDITSVSIVDSLKPTKVKDWFNSFTALKSFNFKDGDKVLLDLSDVDSIYQMFFGCTALESIDLTGLNTSNIATFTSLFRNCTSLKSVNMSDWNTSEATSMRTMFHSCDALESIDLSNFNTAKVTDIAYMFYGCSTLESLDLTSFNTVSVTYMGNMFEGCTNLKSIDLTSFNTAAVTQMQCMFKDCAGLTSIEFNSSSSVHLGENFTTAAVNNMEKMFNGCTNLNSLDLASFNTASVTNMKSMFENCSELDAIRIGSSWKTASDAENILSGCTALVIKDGQLGENTITYSGSDNSGKELIFIISGCTFADASTEMLAVKVTGRDIDKQVSYFAKDATSITLSPANAGGTWSSHVVTLKSAKKYAFATVDKQIGGEMRIYNRYNIISNTFVPDNMDTAIWKIYQVRPDYDLYTADQQNGTNNAEPRVPGSANPENRNFWSRASNPANANPNTNDEAQVAKIVLVDPIKPKNTKAWFANFKYCTEIILHDADGNMLLDTSDINTFKIMFKDCAQLQKLNLSGFDTQGLKDPSYDMYQMFMGCSSLTEVIFGDKFTASTATSMGYMFNGCKSLISLDLSKFNTGKVTNMVAMFSGCESLTTLKLSDKFNASTVKSINMGHMFNGCKSLTNLDLSKFNVTNPTTMAYMFNGCSSLTELNLSGFNNAGLKVMTYPYPDMSQKETNPCANMFNNCSALTKIIVGSGWSTNNDAVNASENVFTGCTKLVGGNSTAYNASNVTGVYARVDTSDNPGYFTAAEESAMLTLDMGELAWAFADETQTELLPHQDNTLILLDWVLPEMLAVIIDGIEYIVPDDGASGISYDSASGVLVLPASLITDTTENIIVAKVNNTPNIELDWSGIDSNLEWYFPDSDNYHPIAGMDYSIIFEASEGYTLPKFITVIIDSRTYNVSTSEKSPEGEPSFDKESGMLTIPAELLTEDTLCITIIASAIEADDEISSSDDNEDNSIDSDGNISAPDENEASSDGGIIIPDGDINADNNEDTDTDTSDNLTADAEDMPKDDTIEIPDVTIPEVPKTEEDNSNNDNPNDDNEDSDNEDKEDTEINEPEVSEPEVSEPEVSVPEVCEPEVSEPEVSVPEVSEPEVCEPEVSEPEVSEPEVSEPEVSEPEVSEPEVSEPEVSEPEVSESTPSASMESPGNSCESSLANTAASNEGKKESFETSNNEATSSEE